MRQLLAAVIGASALAACATHTVYAPATSASAVGFSEAQIESNRWRVTFRGGTDAQPGRAYDLALRRAAELTLAQRNDWFEVVDRRTDVAPGNGPTFSIGLGGGSFGRGGGLGGGVGTDLGGPGTQSTVTLEVLVGRGPKPTTTAYDARSLLNSMAVRPI